MRQDRSDALKLRLKGYSYSEILKLLGVPKSTLSGWFNGLELPRHAQERIQKRVRIASLKGLTKNNKIQTHLARQRALNTRKEASKQIKNLSHTNLRLLGSALYWAEGYKRPVVTNGKERTQHPISLTNSDPELIKLFVKFLKEICEVSPSQIHADIRLFEHMNEQTVIKYWLNVTKLPKDNFGKFYYGISKSSQHKRPYNRLPYGTIQIRVNCTQKFHQVMGWIEGLKKIV